MGNSSDVVVGAYVEITLAINPAERSKGKVSRILSGLGSDRTTVVLTNGDKGDVTRVIRSTAIIRERIMAEGQTTENKENFGEAVMREKVIPQTVQSFSKLRWRIPIHRCKGYWQLEGTAGRPRL